MKNISTQNNKLNIVAIDGFRLALRTINIPVQVNDFKAVIPAKTLNEVNKILTDSFDNVKIGVSKIKLFLKWKIVKL